MSVRRATRFLRNVIIFALALITIFILLAAIELVFHPFTPWINRSIAWFIETEELLSVHSLMGISLGMIVLTVLVCLFPLVMPKVNKKQFRTTTFRGVIASLVFFFTQLLYTWAETFGNLHLIGAMLVAIIITLIVIEFLSLLSGVDEEVSLRTDLLAAAASGLASGIVIKLVQVLIGQLKA